MIDDLQEKNKFKEAFERALKNSNRRKIERTLDRFFVEDASKYDEAETYHILKNKNPNDNMIPIRVYNQGLEFNELRQVSAIENDVEYLAIKKIRGDDQTYWRIPTHAKFRLVCEMHPEDWDD